MFSLHSHRGRASQRARITTSSLRGSAATGSGRVNFSLGGSGVFSYPAFCRCGGSLPVRNVLVCGRVSILLGESEVDDVHLHKVGIETSHDADRKLCPHATVRITSVRTDWQTGPMDRQTELTGIRNETELLCTYIHTWFARLPRPIRKLSGLMSLWRKLFE